jgi:hypothetical protein
LMAAMHPALPPPMISTSAGTTFSGNFNMDSIESRIVMSSSLYKTA